MNILVTGGAGFIGSHLVKALLNKNFRVVVLDDLSTGKKERIKPPVVFYQGDLRERDFVTDVLAKEQPNIIFHLAAQVSVQESLKDPIGDAQTNILGTLNLLDQAVKNKAQKIIFASSAAVYGTPKYLPVDEAHPAEVLSGYAVSKLAVEHYLAVYKNLYNLDYTVLRLANVFGPGQLAGTEGGVVAIFIQNLLEGKVPAIFGDGEQTRDFIYVQDVVAANLAALNRGTGKIINISTCRPTSVNSLYKLLQEMTGRTTASEYHRAKPGDIRNSVLDNKLAIQLLAWQPSYTLEEGLNETVRKWYSI